MALASEHSRPGVEFRERSPSLTPVTETPLLLWNVIMQRNLGTTDGYVHANLGWYKWLRFDVIHSLLRQQS